MPETDLVHWAVNVHARRELMPAEIIEQAKAERRKELLDAGRWVHAGRMQVRLEQPGERSC